MPLDVVRCEEHGGYRCQCRIRAAARADPRGLAVRKVWGDAACWVPHPGTDQGRVSSHVGDEEDHGHPRTGLMTVEVVRATHTNRRTVCTSYRSTTQP